MKFAPAPPGKDRWKKPYARILEIGLVRAGGEKKM